MDTPAFCYLTTRGRRTGRAYTIEIWFVVIGRRGGPSPDAHPILHARHGRPRLVGRRGPRGGHRRSEVGGREGSTSLSLNLSWIANLSQILSLDRVFANSGEPAPRYATIVALHITVGYNRRVELDIAPTVCRYDGCTLGPEGGPAPLVQPLRGANTREASPDRHRPAPHRAPHTRPLTRGGAPAAPGRAAPPT